MNKIVRFVLLKRRRDLTHEQFSAYWCSRHVEVLMASGLRDYNASYTQNHFAALPGYSTDALRFDGAPQMLQCDASVIQSGFQQDPRYLNFVRPDEDMFLEAGEGQTLFADVVEVNPGHGTATKLMIFASYAVGVTRERGKAILGEWNKSLLREGDVAASSCNQYFAIAGATRGALPHFDVVLEFCVKEESAAISLFSNLNETWPTVLEKGSCFPVLSRARFFY